MATFPQSVLQWGPVVDAELIRSGVPLPRDLVLAVIRVESGGVVGNVNPKSGASGLMQVMPGTLDHYNKLNPMISLATLRSKLPQHAVEQIRVGLWVLSTYWKSAYKYLSNRMVNVPIDELARIADLFYVAGPGATRKRLDKLSQPLWASILASFPQWNALPHPKNVFVQISDLIWPVEKISNWLDKSIPKGLINMSPKSGFAIGTLAILIAWWMFKKGTRDVEK